MEWIYQILLDTMNASPLVHHRSFIHPSKQSIRAEQFKRYLQGETWYSDSQVLTLNACQGEK